MKNNIQKLLEKFPADIDAGVVLGGSNRKYFLDMQSSAGTIFITKEEAYFIIDSRYHELATKTVTSATVLLEQDLIAQIRELISKHNVRTVATDNSYVTVTRFLALEEQVKPAKLTMDGAFDTAILSVRKYKEEEEVVRMQKAQNIAELALDHIVKWIRIGMTEKEIAMELERVMKVNGADDISFGTIVASGENSSKPHAVPGDRKIQKGDFITMDFGALVDGYHSDMTRTIAVSEVSEKQKEVYETVLAAQKAAIEAISIGKTCSAVDKVARDIITEAGYGENFQHGLGHSVGVEIHEDPRFSMACNAPVEEGIVMTVEPGIYLPGEFGVRIEDMGIVTKDGLRNFTSAPKELIIIEG